MTSFIKNNDRIINLQNVSNINIVTRDQRIVFNLNYGIEIEKRGKTKVISDYVYLDTRSTDDFNNAKDEVQFNDYVEKHFIKHRNGYINKNEISSVKFSDKKNRVIFNLSHSITFTDYNTQEDRLTSEFVYVDFTEFSEYKSYSATVKQTLNLK